MCHLLTLVDMALLGLIGESVEGTDSGVSWNKLEISRNCDCFRGIPEDHQSVNPRSKVLDKLFCHFQRFFMQRLGNWIAYRGSHIGDNTNTTGRRQCLS